MTLSLTVERPVRWRPSRFSSRVVSRYVWLWFAFKRIKVSEYEYATTAWAWEGG